jgi:hypothetical protein
MKDLTGKCDFLKKFTIEDGIAQLVGRTGMGPES